MYKCGHCERDLGFMCAMTGYCKCGLKVVDSPALLLFLTVLWVILLVLIYPMLKNKFGKDSCPQFINCTIP